MSRLSFIPLFLCLTNSSLSRVDFVSFPSSFIVEQEFLPKRAIKSDFVINPNQESCITRIMKRPDEELGYDKTAEQENEFLLSPTSKSWARMMKRKERAESCPADVNFLTLAKVSDFRLEEENGGC